MQCCNLLFIVTVLFYKTSAFLNDELELSGRAMTMAPLNNRNEKGYECGNVFYRDSEVNAVLSLGLQNADKGYFYPQRYSGQIYKDVESVEYLLWPIKKEGLVKPRNKNTETTHSIVFTKNSQEVIDVIAKITNHDFTKCIRRDGSQVDPSSSVLEVTNGYQCGHEFIGDAIIVKSVGLAQMKIGKNLKYPAPYVGRLYPVNSGYMVWPIFRGKKLYETGKFEAGPFYIVLDGRRQLVEAVVKGFSNNYLRCTRSREFQKAPASDPHSNLFVPPPKSGYLCGKAFFDDKIVENLAITAMSFVRRKRVGQYPKEYIGHPFNELCLLWPISAHGTLLLKGREGPYRLVMEMNFKVKCVAIVGKGKMEACDRKLIKGKKNHDTSDYICGKTRFPNEQLIRAADTACERLKIDRKRLYPAKYEGPKFEKDGPYFTFPIFLDRNFMSYVGPNRVVINSNCEVVGALTTIFLASKLTLIKCPKIDADTSPDEILNFSHVHVDEHIRELSIYY